MKLVNYKWTPRLPMWRCKCDCGKTVEVRGHIFNKKTIVSCGCYRSDVSRELCLLRSKAPGVSFKNHVVSRIKSGAKKRDIPFSLTTDQVINIIMQPCVYCGQEPKMERKARHAAIDRYGFLTNSLDRIDSDQGYCPQNVVACCFDCNIMKSSLSTAQFLEHIKKIFNHSCINPS